MFETSNSKAPRKLSVIKGLTSEKVAKMTPEERERATLIDRNLRLAKVAEFRQKHPRIAVVDGKKK